MVKVGLDLNLKPSSCALRAGGFSWCLRRAGPIEPPGVPGTLADMSRTAFVRATLTVLSVATVLSGGCGIPYDCRWSAAGKTPAVTQGIEGRWQGTWTSDQGHAGGLRCIITPAGDGTYTADFRATWGWIFGFGYRMKIVARATDGELTAGGPHAATTRPGVVYFDGSADLGWLAGGEYRYDGRAGTTTFFANYSSGADRGRFQMVRPGGVPPVN